MQTVHLTTCYESVTSILASIENICYNCIKNVNNEYTIYIKKGIMINKFRENDLIKKYEK